MLLGPFTMHWSTQIDFHFFHRSGPLSDELRIQKVAAHSQDGSFRQAN
jgi:hypothetical protein